VRVSAQLELSECGWPHSQMPPAAARQRLRLLAFCVREKFVKRCPWGRMIVELVDENRIPS